MKHILLKSFIIVILFSTVSFAFAYSNTYTNTVGVNNVSNLVVVNEYKCRMSNVDCVVDKIRYIQTGKVYYDAECNVQHMLKTEYENNAIADVEKGYNNYCSPTERTLKMNN